MKLIKINLTILLICGLALTAKINAQETSSLIDFTYKFEIKNIVKGDTLPLLYCVMRVNDLLNFDRVNISYNDQTLSYYTQHLIRVTSEDYILIDDFVYFKIKEELDAPYAIIEVVDLEGKKYEIKERNANDQIINPRNDMEKWVKSADRIDSMDYVRHFNGVYSGREGKPRFRDNSGKVYIIEKDHVRPE